MKNWIIFVWFSCSCLTMLFSEEVEYDIVLLCPKGKEVTTETRAFDLSENGDVVGTIENYPQWPVTKGFLYNPDTGFQVVMGDKENADLVPQFVNENGVVAGYANQYEWEISNESASCTCVLSPFIYNLQSGEFNVLNNLEAEVLGISSNGKVLLFNYSDWKLILYDLAEGERKELNGDYDGLINASGDVATETTYYPENGEGVAMGSLDQYGRWPVEIQALSDNGIVAGVGRNTQKEKRGFIWSVQSGYCPINTLGSNTIKIYGVNNAGNAVGFSKTSFDDPHAMIFDRRLGTIDLKTLGGQTSFAYDLNDSLQVVGSSDSALTESKKSERHAFIWDAQNGMRDLNDLIPKNTGWLKLSKAEKINDRGCIIGHGIYLGQKHAFLLIPKS